MARKRKLGQSDVGLLHVREKNLRRCGSLFRMDPDPSAATEELACRAGVLNTVRLADRDEILKKARTEIPRSAPEDRRSTAAEKIQDLESTTARALSRCPSQFKGDAFVQACQVGTRFASNDIAEEISAIAKEHALSGRRRKRRSGLRKR